MYVRQLKQFIRAVDQTFDERKWGFATVMEFLRVCQREGIFRLERDRRGQIRVFPGSALQTAPIVTASAAVAEQQLEANGNVYEAEPVESSDERIGPHRIRLADLTPVGPASSRTVEADRSEAQSPRSSRSTSSPRRQNRAARGKHRRPANPRRENQPARARRRRAAARDRAGCASR